MTELPAEVPKTDRELLLQIHQDMSHLRQKIEGQDGNGGLCAIVMNQEKRLSELEKSKWYIAGALGLLLLLVGTGRLIEILYVVPR